MTGILLGGEWFDKKWIFFVAATSVSPWCFLVGQWRRRSRRYEECWTRIRSGTLAVPRSCTELYGDREVSATNTGDGVIADTEPPQEPYKFFNSSEISRKVSASPSLIIGDNHQIHLRNVSHLYITSCFTINELAGCLEKNFA